MPEFFNIQAAWRIQQGKRGEQVSNFVNLIGREERMSRKQRNKLLQTT
jgi:hypothetical protein